jgi:hypothetical protein
MASSPPTAGKDPTSLALKTIGTWKPKLLGNRL